MLNSPGSATYPIASFTYLLLPKDMSTNPTLDQTKAKALVDFITWAITDGLLFMLRSVSCLLGQVVRG
jgi:uncharacterized protein YqgV (UPF0045/DUF77 family)